jgi:hypothetical protein
MLKVSQIVSFWSRINNNVGEIKGVAECGSRTKAGRGGVLAEGRKKKSDLASFDSGSGQRRLSDGLLMLERFLWLIFQCSRCRITTQCEIQVANLRWWCHTAIPLHARLVL